MKTLMLCVMIVVVCGCASPAYSYVEANKKNADTLFPDVIQYINSDAQLSDLDKEVRSKSVQAWWDLINEAYTQYTEEQKAPPVEEVKPSEPVVPAEPVLPVVPEEPKSENAEFPQ